MVEPLTIDARLREIHDELNRIWSERYVTSNDDIGYIKKMWDITTIIQKGSGYEGEYIQPWSSVEQIMTDCYLDLISNNNNKTDDHSSKRVESLMQLYDTAIGYIFEKINNKKPGDIEKYLKSNISILNN